jgi:protein-disulfide isomerase
MHRTFVCLMTILFMAGSGGAQQKPAAANAAGKKATSGPKSGESKTAETKLPSEETVNSFMHQMFGYDPSLSWKVNEVQPSEVQGMSAVALTIAGPQGPQYVKLYVTGDEKYAFPAEPMPFGAKPFEVTREELNKGLNGPSRGPADAAVTIVEFSDFQCPHCKEAAPIVERLLAEEPKAHFVFQNFPLPSHNWAHKAAQYGDCVGRASSDAFWKFAQKTFETQEQITDANADEKLTAIANDSGVKGADIATCAAKPETSVRVEHSIALGKEAGVTGTPTLFINGRKVPNLGIPMDTLKQLVDFAGKQ